VIDRSLPRLRELDVQFHGAVQTIFSTADRSNAPCRCGPGDRRGAGAGAAAPKARHRSDDQGHAPGSVVVDIAIDQGGCFSHQPARPRTPTPVYVSTA
jgi:alanine dehydrogenase